MSRPIPLDIVRMVGGLVLSTPYREKVDVSFQYELADGIARLINEERSKTVRYLERQAEIHEELSEQIVGGDTDDWHGNMQRQFLDASTAIQRGAA